MPFLCRKNTPWKPILDKLILQLQAAGIIDQWFKEEFNPAVFLKEPKTNKEEPLKVIHIAFALSMLALGNGLAVIVFIIEYTYKKGNRPTKKNTHKPTL